ncbi:MAG: NAD(P)H-hydrate epimerase [Candidatus Omnitrophica bacterium]|nr:NAD(P)H-hydrate epimerase [Candidatus Omnitrophota bacterium]
MIKGISVEEIRHLEESAGKIGLSERTLIENASSNLAFAIDSLNLGKKVCVVSGRGNNGADALACARKLAARNYEVSAVILKEKDFNPEVKFQKEILESINLQPAIIEPGDIKKFKRIISVSDFILDGILGIGVRGEVSGFLKETINCINKIGKKIVSCDIPSGLSPDTGCVLGEAVKADYTITFIAPKKGFFSKTGKKFCGKIFVTDIGISGKMLKDLCRK